MLTSIIIPKPNKVSYDIPKTFRLIILLNTLGKLIKKVIGKRLHFQLLSKNVIYSCQLDELIQQSTTDAGIKFFPFFNHQLLLLILDKAGFNFKISQFF